MSTSFHSVYSGVKKNSDDRRKNDFYATPPIATFVLTKFSDVPTRVMEPCAGRGNISKELIRQGHEVLSFDLNAYENSLVEITTSQDFMELGKQDVEGVVTNPPYLNDLPRKMALKCIEEYDYTAFLLRLTFLEGMKRKQTLFEPHPPSQLLFFSDRVKFSEDVIDPLEYKDQVGGMISYVWVIWEKNKIGTEVKWVSCKEHYDEWRQQHDQ